MEYELAPLADRMRPKTMAQFIGQKHIVGEKLMLYRAIESKMLPSCIFYGPPGTGKTTLAGIISNMMGGNFAKISAISSGVGDAKKIIEEAKKSKLLYGKPTVLLLDECHRWSKAQSDCLLGAIEDGTIIFVGSTTENPYTSMTPAIVSRCKIFQFMPLSETDIQEGIKNAIADKENGFGSLKLRVDEDAICQFAFACGGDMRSALTSLELAVKTTEKNENGEIIITKNVAVECSGGKALSLDINSYYDYLSAFCKSIRGSDVDAALFYMQRMVLAGVDPQIIARRLIAHCSEDIGMADSNALLLANVALSSCKTSGYPECMLNLSHAVIYATLAPKSNSVVVAMNMAEQDAKNNPELRPPYHLLNHPSINDRKKTKYKYSHDYGGYVDQQYLPDALVNNRYYFPSENGREKSVEIKKLAKKNGDKN